MAQLSIAAIGCTAQHDMNIANSTAAAVRADINAALPALASHSSGATEPATRYAYQFWADTTTGYLKQRNAANTAWVNLWALGSAPSPMAGNTGLTTVGTVTAGSWNAGGVTATASALGAGAVIGANDNALGYGVMGIAVSGTGVMGMSTTVGRGLYGSTNLGIGATIVAGGTQTANRTNPVFEVTRSHATAGYSNTGNIINVNDSPTGVGTVSGYLFQATVDSVERIRMDPRVANEDTATAYIFDTKQTLTGAQLVSLKTAGTEKFAVAANGGIRLKSGANTSAGRATLVAGTVTVANTSVTANSLIFLTVSTAGGTRGYLSTTKSAGTSFTITSTSATETSVVDWHIVEMIL